MKNFSNKYIFIYSAALVAVVAVILSVVAMGLKDRQNANVRNEKMQTLLAAINVNCSRDEAADLYNQYFDSELTVATDGSVVSVYNVKDGKLEEGDVRAFDIKLKEQQNLEKAGQKGAFPVYLFTKDGRKGYVIPTQGNGLWGAIFSNIALDEDFNTIIGVTFSHESETPGLGAEITTQKFQAPFVGKQILDENGQVISIAVKKNADANGMHEVDAITGGTMTSNGVNEMLATNLMRYQKFIDATRTAPAAEEAMVENAIEEEVSNE
ncbi:MAG: NADH:ubiquinone reductase (Na(+)-transporting) subunit C [Bacteroidales bacterium]|nr:NADH:ubiquinone reductase (Na(+)-transporting) subunit C [Candidatus Colimorpha merdihippi]MCQ2282269.1 NADH:ubiquinone reductase (Na(+)-transporting) subunit C [Bacteroidales bacterium]